MESESGAESYDIAEVAGVLRTQRMREWLREGLITCVAFVGDNRLSKAYIDTLAEQLNMNRRYMRTRYIELTTTVALYNLSVEYEQTAANAKKSVLARLDDLLKVGSAIPFSAFVDMMPPYAARGTVNSWRKRKRLPAYLIGRQYYISVRVCQEIVWFFEHCITTAQVAELTGLDIGWVQEKIRQGDWPARYGPDQRSPRMAPEVVEQICGQRQQERLSYAETAQRLGVSVRTVRRRASRIGLTVVDNMTPSIPVELVAQWQSRFAMLNPGYDWLIRIVGDRPRTLNSSQAVRTLGISKPTLWRFCKGNLLPYYTRSFTEGAMPNRYFVQLYITCLVRFAGGKPTYAQAREYLERCQQIETLA